MVTNPNWPLMAVQVAFNAGLNTTTTPTWTDLTPRLWSLGCDRGRQYELDQVQAGVGQLVLADSDELLNPANTTSPYYPSVLPYRQILVQAQWPPAPVGSAVNLLNSAAVPVGYDPTFENTSVGAAPPNLITIGTAPTVQAANPWQGTKSLQWTKPADSVDRHTGFVIPCIPGRQYTASGYIRQTAANTTTIFIEGVATGTSTTTTGAYVRLTVTFTATQPTHHLWFGCFAQPLASTINLDAVQVEPGSSASAFSTTGPVIYGVHRGYVERWPSKWNYKGLYGYAEITTVDGFAALAAKKLHTEYRNVLSAKQPDLWWPLGDGSNANAWADVSGHNAPALTRVDRPGSSSTANAPSFSSGTDTNMPGDPGGTGVSINYGSPATGQPITYLQTGDGQSPRISVDVTQTPSAVTVAVWASWTGSFPGDSGDFFTLEDAYQTSAFLLQWDYNQHISCQSYSTPPGQPSNSTGYSVNVTGKGDGKPHLIVAVLLNDANGTESKLYFDGALIGVSGYGATGTYGMRNPFTAIFVGSGYNPQTGTTFAGLPGGVYSHVAVWKHELSAQDISDLWTAGEGYPGETSGQRIARYLTGNYNGSTAIDAGQSTMAASDLADATILLDACQAVTLSENGNLWVDGNGVLQFAARGRRYYATISQATFGEQENPYEDDIAYDYDPTLVYNDIEVQQSGGTNATASDATSQTNYGPRSYQRQINIASGLEAIDAANWILSTHKDPHQRIATLTIRPSHNPALWPIALGAEIGQRVTVKRRTTAGLTMSSDYFIEQISHSQKPDEWTVSFQMSPAVGYQVGIFDDATYGRFDQTLIFGY